ncbi:hypothetical protein SO802_012199 [Lithocarpus litseifolius]|uniref:Retrotransposon Copia-like N-terminal domain-containing protein n=1 Tax=Lithocarpus litseifolius TaxID=425828 RepID=A0AAW2D232_9ROSI
MASTSSTSSSTSTIAMMTNPLTQINSSLLLLSNMSSMVMVKLDYSNYIVWKHQIEKSGRRVWKVLEKRFASVSRSSVMSLRNELNSVKKGTDSIDVYFQRIKQIRDKLAVVLVILDDEELLHVALDGLPSEYASFSSAIRTRSDFLLVEELNTLLNTKERAIKKRFGFVDANTMAMAANFQSEGFGRGKGRNNNQRGHGGRGFNFNGGNGFDGGRGFNGSNGFIGGNVS